MDEKIILVDENDNEIGFEEKLEVHKKGKLHRAFSIFVFNSKGELLIQKRAKNKYHSGGLWTNTCCSHPHPGENLEEAVHRRLKEEMGFDCNLKEIFSFIYKVKFENGLTENELDHVFIGVYDGEVKPNQNEVEDFKWVNINTLLKDIQFNEDKYTYWFKLILPKVVIFVK
ncbi:Isopentenyl-diphosphate Delta-isomerase [bacterium HR34]|nr:Isopentenyl-diphosphate Delta-isomerase [bacterium HR34]